MVEYKGAWKYTRECRIEEGGCGNFFKTDVKYARRCEECKFKIRQRVRKERFKGAVTTGMVNKLYRRYADKKYGKLEDETKTKQEDK
jgi:hypothetical protein